MKKYRFDFELAATLAAFFGALGATLYVISLGQWLWLAVVACACFPHG